MDDQFRMAKPLFSIDAACWQLGPRDVARLGDWALIPATSACRKPKRVRRQPTVMDHLSIWRATFLIKLEALCDALRPRIPSRPKIFADYLGHQEAQIDPRLCNRLGNAAPSPGRLSPSMSSVGMDDAVNPAPFAALIVFLPDTGASSIAALLSSPG